MGINILDMYAGAEELELEGGTSTVVDAVEEAVRTEIAEVSVAVEEQSAQIEQLVDQVNDMEEAVEEVGEVVEGLESLLGSGNFNSLAFSSMYNRGVKLANKLGGNIQGDRMGAEAISDASTAQLMARQGMESIMDTIKEYGRKAAEFIKHIFNVVISFFVGIFNKAAAIEKRAEGLKKRINDGAKIKENIKLGGWNVYFDYAKNGLSESAKNSKGFEGTAAAVSGLTALGKNVGGLSLEAFKTAYASVVSAIKADAKSVGKYNEKKNGSSNIVIGVAAGIRVQAAFHEGEIKDFAEAATAARSLKVVFGKDPEAKKLTSGDVKAKADKAALLAALEGARTGAAILRGAKVEKAFSAAERDRVVGSLQAMKAVDKDAAQKNDVDKQITLVKAVFASSASIAQSVTKAAASAAAATLDGVSAHLSF
jgi:hypothetical protein